MPPTVTRICTFDCDACLIDICPFSPFGFCPALLPLERIADSLAVAATRAAEMRRDGITFDTAVA